MSNVIGTVETLSSGSRTLTIPDGTKYVFVLARDITPISIGVAGQVGTIPLNAATSTDAGDGGFLDSIGFPFLLTTPSIVLSGTGSAKFCAWASTVTPRATMGS